MLIIIHWIDSREIGSGDDRFGEPRCLSPNQSVTGYRFIGILINESELIICGVYKIMAAIQIADNTVRVGSIIVFIFEPGTEYIRIEIAIGYVFVSLDEGPISNDCVVCTMI